MRKLLILVLIIILLAALGIMLTSGIAIGSFEIPSIKKIIDENKDLDTKIAELNTAIENDYASARTSLDTSIKTLESEKQKYQDTITYSTEEEIKAANQTEEYEISYLWTKIGLYATNNNVTIQANVSSGTVAGLYNISFTARGEYISISEFVYAIENDSTLGFKIEDFALVPYSENTLQATFIIRNIAIDEDSLSAAGAITQTQQNNTTGSTGQESEQQNTVGVDVPSAVNNIVAEQQ